MPMIDHNEAAASRMLLALQLSIAEAAKYPHITVDDLRDMVKIARRRLDDLIDVNFTDERLAAYFPQRQPDEPGA